MELLYKKERKDVVKIGKRMDRDHLVLGTWGNISLKIEENRIAITPSGMDYDKIDAEDIVITDLQGNIIDSKRKPSIELFLHLNIYQNRNDIKAIIHTHSEYTTAFAIARKGIPGAAEDMVQIAGGDIRVSEYSLPGSKQLGVNAVKALEGRNAVILANHGCLAAAKNLKEALKVAMIVEKSAKATVFANILGGVVELSQSDIDFMRDFYLNKYGQR